MIKLIDLHLHTTSSDGILSPRDTVNYAKKKGLSTIAITDHDTARGVKEAVDEGNKIGIKVISGVEMSADDELRIHIIGLNFDYQNNNPLTEKLEYLRTARLKRLEESVRKLNNIGVNVSEEEILNNCKSDSIGKPHITSAIIEKGFASTVREACEKYLDKGCPGYVKRDKTTAQEAIELILAAGGIPIFAHPGKLKKNMSMEQIIKVILRLKSYGCIGIEAYYSDYDEKTTREFENIADKYDLLVSGGSDYHGDSIKPGIDLGSGRGNLRIEEKVLDKILSRNTCKEGLINFL